MTFSSDLSKAQSRLDHAKALNAKVEIERQRMIAALSQAIVVIILFVVGGLWALSHAEGQLKTRAIVNQENVQWPKQ